MALCYLRLRRALPLSSTLIKHQRPFSAISASHFLSSITAPNSQNPRLDITEPHNHFHIPFQSRLFRSSTVTLSPPPRSSYNNNNNNNNEEIGPDTILFEGCDYNHWLITMDFPKDPIPTPEEMVETYVQTLAKVVGSVEEAKERMYACSTTTYTGFQAVMSEEMSEKFKGLPGVVFILPDSYIDPVNKEYGGDKYIKGTIIPRGPPVHYGRQGGRFGDRNRDFNRDRPRGPPPFQRNSAYDNQGSMQGDTRNHGALNSPPQQNYGPPGLGERRGPPPYQGNPAYDNQGPMHGDSRNHGAPNGPPPQNYGPPGLGERGGPPPYQGNSAYNNQGPMRGDTRNHGAPNSPPPQNYGPPGLGESRGPPPYQGNSPYANQGSMHGDTRNYAVPNNSPPQNYVPTGLGERRDHMPMNGPLGGRDTYQGERRDPMPSYQANYNPAGPGNYHPQGASGTYGQGVGGAHGQEMGSGYGQSHPGQGGDQRFSQVEQRNNMQGEQRNNAAMGHTGTDQGRY